MLNLTDGTHSAAIHFVGTYQEANFSFVSDGQNGTIVYDPPVGSDLPVVTSTGSLAGAMDSFLFRSTAPGSIPLPSPGSFEIADGHGAAVSDLRQLVALHWDSLPNLATPAMPDLVLPEKHGVGQDYHLLS